MKRRAFIKTALLGVSGVVATKCLPGSSLRFRSRAHRTAVVVDDQSSIRDLVRTILEEFGGWQVIEAATSHQALAVAEHRKIDLVISDIVRPGRLDGLEFLEVFKKIHPKIPVMILTVNSSPTIRCRAMRSGASTFMSKPFLCQELLAAAEVSCQLSRSCRKLPSPTYV